MINKQKPRDYSLFKAQMLVAAMKRHGSMAAACASHPDLPSYNTARRWLSDHAEFRAIYPNCYNRIFGGKSEAQLRAGREHYAQMFELLS